MIPGVTVDPFGERPDHRHVRTSWRLAKTAPSRARIATGALLTLLALTATARGQWQALPELPGGEGFAGMFAGRSHGMLLAAGGANFPDKRPWDGGRKQYYRDILVLGDGSGWTRIGQLPAAVAYGCCVSWRDQVVCVGGTDGRTHFDSVLAMEYVDGRLELSELPALPTTQANACGALVGDTLCVLGGTEAIDSVRAMTRGFALDLAATTPVWRELPPLPAAGRVLAVAGAHDGSLYVLSGASLRPDAEQHPVRTYLRDAWRLQLARSRWQRLEDLPRPAVAAPSPAPIIGSGSMLILGGDDGSQAGIDPRRHLGFARSSLHYHLVTDRWTTSEAPPVAVVTAPVVATDDGSFTVVSGELRPGVRTPTVQLLTPKPAVAPFRPLDHLALWIYLLATVGLGVWFARRNRTTDDFFRGGRRVPWWAAGLSIFATMLSSITCMAIPARAFASDWELYLANSYVLLTPILLLVVLPFYRRLDVTSAYEYLERRFAPSLRLFASSMFLLFQCGRVAVVLLLPSLALATVSDLDVTTSILVLGILCIVYTSLGGIEAVIWTDTAQSVVLLGGAVWAFVAILTRVDGGLGAVITEASAQGKFFDNVEWSIGLREGAFVILLGSLFHHLFPYAASQDVVQRYLTTRDIKETKRALWLSMIVSVPAQALFFLLGTALFVFYRDHPERLDPALQNDAILPFFLVRELPAGVAGIIVAGIFAAAQSTLSSSLNSMSTAWVTDFDSRLRPDVDDAARLRLARRLTVVLGLFGTAAAIALAHVEVRSLWDAFLTIIGLFGGTIAGLFGLGMISRRANARGAMIGAIAGSAATFWAWFAGHLHFYSFGMIGVLTCVGVGWTASCLMPTHERVDPDLGVWRHTNGS